MMWQKIIWTNNSYCKYIIYIIKLDIILCIQEKKYKTKYKCKVEIKFIDCFTDYEQNFLSE